MAGDLSTLLAMPSPAIHRNPPPIDPHGTRAAIRQTAEEFESLFLGQMFDHMYAGVDTNGPFGGGPAEKIFRSLLVQEYGKIIARSGGTGIADSVERQLLQLQEIDP